MRHAANGQLVAAAAVAAAARATVVESTTDFLLHVALQTRCYSGKLRCRTDSGRSVQTLSASLHADWLSYTRASGSPRCCQDTSLLKQKLRRREHWRTLTFGYIKCWQRVAFTELLGVLLGKCLSEMQIDNSIVKAAGTPIFKQFKNLWGLLFMV